MDIKIAPSILAANPLNMGEDIKKAEDAGVEYLHLDIMDGHFVPNLSFGPHHVKSIRKVSKLFFDTHLMISEPEKYIEVFKEAGSDLITFHAEVMDNQEQMVALADKIHSLGIKAGISIKPKTPASVLKGILNKFDLVLIMSVEPGFGNQSYIQEVNPKIAEIKKMAEEENPDIDIEVDGGVNAKTISMPVENGANVLVAGSAVFGAEDIESCVKELRSLISSSVRG